MQHHYAEAFPSHGAVFSELYHFHVSHDERSHIVRALPGLWHKRQGSNLHIWESKSHALPFGYACICPRLDTSLRGARGSVPHERYDLSALIVGCIARAAYRGGGVKR